MEGVDDDKCSMEYCPNTFDTEKMFFNFPTDLNLCMQWVERCGKKEYLELLSYSGVLPFLSKYVCEDHFSEEDLLMDISSSRILKEDAIPKPLIKSEQVLLPEEWQPYFVPLKSAEGQQNPEITEIKKEPVDDPSEVLRENLNAIENCSINENQPKSKIRRRRPKAAELARQRRQRETPEKRAERLEKERMRKKIKREQEKQLSLTDPEVEERLRIKRMREALLAAIKRQNESPEEGAMRREKERLRVREKRRREKELSKSDPELAAKLELQKLKFRVMVAWRRQNETPEKRERRRERDRIRIKEKRRKEIELSKEDAHIEEQLQMKRLKDRIVKALKRHNETAEERAKRLEREKIRQRVKRNKNLFELATKCDNNLVNFVAIKSEPQDSDLDNNISPADSLAFLNGSVNSNNCINDANTAQTTREQLLSLQSKLDQMLEQNGNICETRIRNRDNNMSMLDDTLNSDYEEKTEDEDSSDSDDSEYDRYLEGVSSEDSQDVKLS